MPMPQWRLQAPAVGVAVFRGIRTLQEVLAETYLVLCRRAQSWVCVSSCTQGQGMGNAYNANISELGVFGCLEVDAAPELLRMTSILSISSISRSGTG